MSAEQEILSALEENFRRFVEPQALPEGTVARTSTEAALLFELKQKVSRLEWLNQGPDTYDAFQETVPASTTSELRKDYSPFLIWGGSIFNANATGGADLQLRFTDTYGKYKQYRLKANSPLNLDLKGGLGSIINYVSDGTGTVDLRGIILLKEPQDL